MTADLQSADLQSAYLQSANLRSANLQSADLQSANLQSADLQSANTRIAALEEGLRDALAAAYEQGCIDAHKSIQNEPELALIPLNCAEFGEAASDYAESAVRALLSEGN